MTEQEAFDAVCKRRWLDKRTAKESWDAALEWARSQQEPVAHVVNTENCKVWWSDKFTHISQAPKKNTPLYTHPAHAPDVSELLATLRKVEGQANDRIYNIVRPVLAKWEGKQ